MSLKSKGRNGKSKPGASCEEGSPESPGNVRVAKGSEAHIHCAFGSAEWGRDYKRDFFLTAFASKYFQEVKTQFPSAEILQW